MVVDFGMEEYVLSIQADRGTRKGEDIEVVCRKRASDHR